MIPPHVARAKELCKFLSSFSVFFCIFLSSFIVIHSLIFHSKRCLAVGKKQQLWPKEGSSESSESSTKTVTFDHCSSPKTFENVPELKRKRFLANFWLIFGHFWPLLAISKVQKRCKMHQNLKRKWLFCLKFWRKLVKNSTFQLKNWGFFRYISSYVHGSKRLSDGF